MLWVAQAVGVMTDKRSLCLAKGELEEGNSGVNISEGLCSWNETVGVNRSPISFHVLLKDRDGLALRVFARWRRQRLCSAAFLFTPTTFI